MLESLAHLRELKWATERLEARVEFALRRKTRFAPLSDGQIRSYRRDGYLLVSGLIPENLVSAAEAAMWQLLGADPRAPETWAALGPGSHVIRDGRMAATYTDAMLAAAAQLAEDDVAGFRSPTHALTINREPATGEWRPHAPHLDRTFADWKQRTFPRPYRIGAMTFLTDVPRHGGGTIVWPGSHLTLEALARTEPAKYRYLSAFSAELGRIELGPPVELTPSRGDVLFHHYLCVHAASDNTSRAPRLALNHKW
ncbi:MAG: phytanoyl-CoA dioxygenase family protein [Acidobacteria bacterium]|nr:phytanoyl-CoA dioxygenase family protein [Acidobacteriota bacterium]